MLISFFSLEIYVRVGEREIEKRESEWSIRLYTDIDCGWENREKEGTEGGRKWQREKVR